MRIYFWRRKLDIFRLHTFSTRLCTSSINLWTVVGILPVSVALTVRRTIAGGMYLGHRYLRIDDAPEFCDRSSKQVFHRTRLTRRRVLWKGRQHISSKTNVVIISEMNPVNYLWRTVRMEDATERVNFDVDKNLPSARGFVGDER